MKRIESYEIFTGEVFKDREQAELTEQERLKAAINVLIEHCNEQTVCVSCPFYDGGECVLKFNSFGPQSWDVSKL